MMAKWARRARKLGLGRADFFQDELPRVKEEAARSADDLQFTFQSEGISLDAPPTFSEEGLCVVETLYRRNYRSLSDPEQIERLLALLLGQVIVDRHGGSWVIYPGKFHVFSPVVVQLENESRFVEPFLFCTELFDFRGDGARQCRSLARFVADRSNRATP